jgi:hypothetical protein
LEITNVASPLLDPELDEIGLASLKDTNSDQPHRTRVGEVVLGLWGAARHRQLSEYLEPIPVTRLYAAQRAFREVGAVRVAGILRSGLFSLTRVGAPVPFTQVVAELTALLTTTTEDVGGLVARYCEPPGRKEGLPPAVRIRRRPRGGTLPPV